MSETKSQAVQPAHWESWAVQDTHPINRGASGLGNGDGRILKSNGLARESDHLQGVRVVDQGAICATRNRSTHVGAEILVTLEGR